VASSAISTDFIHLLMPSIYVSFWDKSVSGMQIPSQVYVSINQHSGESKPDNQHSGKPLDEPFNTCRQSS